MTLEAALAEITQAIADMAPVHEGLRDYQRLNLTPDAQVDVAQALALYDERWALLMGAKTNLEGLLAAGYPALDVPPVSLAVYDDLVANHSTILAALEMFTLVDEAETLTIIQGVPEPQ